MPAALLVLVHLMLVVSAQGPSSLQPLSLENAAITFSSTYPANADPGWVFDGNASSQWHSGGGGQGPPAWITVDFGATISATVTEFAIQNQLSPNWIFDSPLKVALLGSNDGVSWTHLHETNEVQWSSQSQRQTFAVTAAEHSFRFYQLYFADTGQRANGDRWVVLAEVELSGSFDEDCEGSWSACTVLCESAGNRTWSETTAQSGQGAGCPAATDCVSGEGDCGNPCAAAVTLWDTGNMSMSAYTHNQDCRWLLRCADSRAVPIITFSVFSTEVRHDNVYIYDGSSVSHDERVATLHGQSLPLPLAATGSDATMQFVSDGTIVRDGFAASFYCTVMPTQVPFSSPLDINASSLRTAIDSVPGNDTVGMLSMIGSIVQILNNASGAVISRVDASAARDQLLDAFASTAAVHNSNASAHEISASSNVIAALTEYPEQLSARAVGVALNSISALAEAGEELDYDVDSLAQSTSNVITAVQIQHVQAAAGTVTESDRRATGAKLESIVDSMLNCLSNGLVEGDPPVVITTEQLRLEAKRDNVNAFERQALGGGTVVVPTGFLHNATGSDTVVDAQIASYRPSGGPLFWTPSQLRPSGSIRGSSIVSVTFKATARRRLQSVSEAELDIANLTQPFLITTQLDQSATRVNFSTNLAGKNVSDVLGYIDALWNRSILEAELAAVGGAKQCNEDKNWTLRRAAERAEMQRRATSENKYCPHRPDSCDAARRIVASAPGCPGVRGGVEDCALGSNNSNGNDACSCLRIALATMYIKNSLQCAHFDADTQTWRDDGTLVAANDTHMTCAFRHLTSFSGFIGPAPSFNRMDVAGVFSVAWLTSNRAGAIVALCTLAVSFATALWAIKIYKHLVRVVSTAEQLKEEYELRSSEFLRKRQMLEDPDVSWFTKCEINLRNGWMVGALVAGYPGDPYLRSHRLLVLWGGVLVGMVLNVIFFRKQDPECYSKCPDETYSSGDSGCVHTCTEDCHGNGLLAGLLAAVISIPVTGTLNFLFAWLRKPLERDLSIKEMDLSDLSDTAFSSNSDSALHTDSRVPNKCAWKGSWMRHYCTESWQTKLRCCRATFPVAFRWFAGTAVVEASDKQCATIAQLTAGYTASKRADVGHQRREIEAALEEIWSQYDPERSGSIDMQHLRRLMEDLNRPHAVSDVAVEFVMRTADVSKTGQIDKGELRLAIPTYLALQSEQARIASMFDRFDSENSGFLNQKEVMEMLQELNDHVPPTPAEVAWVIENADSSGNGQLDKSETLRAVALWYPRLHKRRSTTPPPLATQADSLRVEARLLLSTCTTEIELLLINYSSASASSGILLRKDVVAILKEVSAPHRGAESADVNWILDLADCASPECIPREEVLPALALHLALVRSGAADYIRTTFLRQLGSGTMFADQTVTKNDIETLLTTLNGSRAPTDDELSWVVSIANEHQDLKTDSYRSSASTPRRRHDLHRAVALWYPHVHARTPISNSVPPAGSEGTSNAGIRRRAAAVKLPVHRAWVDATFRAHGVVQNNLSVDIVGLTQLMKTLNGGEVVDQSELEFVSLLSDQDMNGRMHRADLQAALAMWRGLQTEWDRIDNIFNRYESGTDMKARKLGRKQMIALLTEINEGYPPSERELEWILCAGKQQHLHPISTGVRTAPLSLVGRLQGGRKNPAIPLEIPPALTSFQPQMLRPSGSIPEAGSRTSAGKRSHQELVSLGTTGAIAVSSESKDESTPLFSPSKTVVSDRQAAHPRSQTQVGRRSGSGSRLSLMQPSDTNSSYVFNHMELRVAICVWYFHCATVPVRPHIGCKILVPFLYTLFVSAGAAYIVAATTLLFSEMKTLEWLGAVAVSLVWRNFVIDPLKAIAFGRSFELVFGLLLGGSCNIEEATLAVLQDEMEGQGETIGEMAGDGAADAFAGLGDGGGIDMQVDGAVMATDTTRIARDTAKEEEEEEEEAENNKNENRQVALDEARPSETTPQPVWAQRSDISDNAGSVARRQGMLGP